MYSSELGEFILHNSRVGACSVPNEKLFSIASLDQIRPSPRPLTTYRKSLMAVPRPADCVEANMGAAIAKLENLVHQAVVVACYFREATQGVITV